MGGDPYVGAARPQRCQGCCVTVVCSPRRSNALQEGPEETNRTDGVTTSLVPSMDPFRLRLRPRRTLEDATVANDGSLMRGGGGDSTVQDGERALALAPCGSVHGQGHLRCFKPSPNPK